MRGGKDVGQSRQCQSVPDDLTDCIQAESAFQNVIGFGDRSKMPIRDLSDLDPKH